MIKNLLKIEEAAITAMAMGYGLKFTDDFKHTSLGWMGNTNQLEQ